MKPRVTVSIVSWNSERVLGHCLESLEQQTYRDFSISLVDNASIDNSVTLVRERFPTASVIKNTRNLGFGRGHNQTILLSPAPLLLFLNPDTILEPTALERLVTGLESDPRIAAVGPKLRRFTLTTDELQPVQYESILDSTGIIRQRTGICLERGAGETDAGQHDLAEDVFGVSAACCLVRRAALEDIRFRGEFFDEDFFAYKEDIDLCWRLRHRGWRVRYLPDAVVYHRRSTASGTRKDPRSVQRSRRSWNRLVKMLSYRNHWLLQVKNLTGGEALRTFPWWFSYEAGKFLFLLLTEPRTLTAVPSAIRLLPRILEKRRQLDHHRVSVRRPARS